MIFDNSTCSRCNHNNPPYKSICEKCKNHLRERVVNIDLWSMILLLIEDPKTAFRNIIYAEHKNFIYFLLFFISIKNLIIARFISVPELGLNGTNASVITEFILSAILTTTFFVLTTLVLFQLQKNSARLRFIDLFSINLYSFIPYLIGLFVIFPVELIVLGSDVFSNNPYAFQIKPTISYILIGFEIILILWTILLYSKSIYIVLTNKLRITFQILFFAILWSLLLLAASKFIFTI